MKQIIIILFLLNLQIVDCKWEKVSMLPDYQMLKCITVLQDSIIISAGDYEVIKLSADLGLTWEVVHNAYIPNSLNGIDYTNEKIFIVGDNGIILLSTDNGSTWERKKRDENQNYNSIKFFDNHGVIVGDSGLVLKSDNYGESWIIVDLEINSNLNEILIHKNSIIIIGDDGKCIKSNLDFTNINQIDFTIQENLRTISLSGNASIFIAGDNATLIKSDEILSDWEVIESVNPPAAFYSIFAKDDSTLYAGCIKDINIKQAYSSDGGVNWTYSIYNNLQINSVSSDSKNNYCYFCGLYGGIMKVDLNKTIEEDFIKLGEFIEISKGKEIQFKYITGVNPKELLAIDNKTVYTSIDSGFHWEEIFQIGTSSISMNAAFISDDKQNIVIAADSSKYSSGKYIYSPKIFFSSDGGKSFSKHNFNFEMFVKQLSFNNFGLGIAFGIYNKIFLYTNNYGSDWDTLNMPSNYYSLDMQVVNDFIYAIGIDDLQNLYFCKTQNLSDWEIFDLDIELHVNIQMFFTDLNTGYLIIPGYEYDSSIFSIYKTNDGAQNWDLKYEGLDDIDITLIDINFYDNLNGVCFGSNGAAYFTTNGGDVWLKDGYNGDNKKYGNIYSPSPEICFIADSYSLWRYTREEPTNVSEDYLNYNKNDFKIFPNPAYSYSIINIQFTLLSNSKIIIEIIDLEGKAISETYTDYFDAGSHNIQYTPDSDLPSGTYWLRMTINNQETIVKPVVIIK